MSIELLSVHVPKCGGITLKSYLTDFYGPSQILLDYVGTPCASLQEEPHSVDKYVDLENIKCIHGHFNLRKYEYYNVDFATTCLRDPVLRLISHYWHCIDNDNDLSSKMVQNLRSGEMSIIDLARHPRVSGLYTQSTFLNVDMTAFDLIGDVDDFDAYAERLGNMLGACFTKRPAMNKNPVANYETLVGELLSDQKMVAAIKDALKDEIRFFERHVGRGSIGSKSAGAPIRAAYRAERLQKSAESLHNWPPRLHQRAGLAQDLHSKIGQRDRFVRRHEMMQSLLDRDITRFEMSSYDFAAGNEVDLIKVDGIPANARFLDIGAGVLRLLPEFAPALEPGQYYAVERNGRALEWGWENLADNRQLRDLVSPQNLIEDGSFDFSWAEDSFDIALASFLFENLPLPALERCLANLGAAMKPGGRFYASLIIAPEGEAAFRPLMRPDSSMTFHDRAPFHFRLSELTTLAQRHGWTLESCTPLTDSISGHHELARFTFNGAESAQEHVALPAPAAPSSSPTPAFANWWSSPRIWQHINDMLGSPRSQAASAGFHTLIARSAKPSFKQAVSLDSEDGAQALRLALTGTVEHFDIWSQSEAGIEAGRAEAERFGLSDKISWNLGTGLSEEKRKTFDLVYWNNRLHMQPDVEVALQWSLKHLRPGGLLAVDGYVGPSRFQYKDLVLAAASRFRAMLPRQLLRVHGSEISPELQRVPEEAMREKSPHLTPDSGRILNLAAAMFPGASVTPTGGCIYQLGLSGIYPNLDPIADSWVVEAALMLDRVLVELGHTHYATILATKPLSR
ncbi:methyltransferase [Bosea beijingensis]|uniref:methyltransferase n=1 Tax=Bosea beijingensis TaxID=3068632 RepID=UPI00274041A4|nr:methyltransferase [Bosea sp. REN20]